MQQGTSLVVVDTTVVSLINRGGELGDYFNREIEGKRAVISFQTLEEQWFGAYLNNWGDRRKNRLALDLDRYEVIWPNPELVDICARLRAERRRSGRELTTADAWIAATALLLQCPLASHDGDFNGIPNLELIRSQ